MDEIEVIGRTNGKVTFHKIYEDDFLDAYTRMEQVTEDVLTAENIMGVEDDPND